jgi:hypothetical protein
MYRGYSLSLIRDLIYYPIYFGTYDQCKKYFLSKKYPSYVYQIIGGSSAGVLGWLVCYPIDFLKTKA